MDPNLAVEWLIEHMDDPNVDEPFTDEEMRLIGSTVYVRNYSIRARTDVDPHPFIVGRSDYAPCDGPGSTS